jgi:hypothetical protein
MTLNRRHRVITVAACLCLGTTLARGAQTSEFLLNSQTPVEPVVTGAPYSGVGTTTLKLILFDGTRIDREVTAKLFRDGAGRIRREQTVIGLDPLKPSSGGSVSVVTIVDPVAGVIYTLNPGDHTAHRMSMSSSPQGPAPVIPPGMLAPPPTRRESLGTRQIDGLAATGQKTVMTIAPGQMGNDRAVEVSDEQWESTELKVLLFSLHHNPQTGDVEYRLTNISRAEPARDLFTVPADYKIMDQFLTTPSPTRRSTRRPLPD